jgi:hypothetical protein
MSNLDRVILNGNTVSLESDIERMKLRNRNCGLRSWMKQTHGSWVR